MKKSLAIKAGATEGDSSALDRLIDFILYTGLVLADDAGTLTKGNLDEVEVPAQTPTPNIEQMAAVATQVKGDVCVQQKHAVAMSVVLHVHLKDWNELTPENAARLRDWIDKVGIPDAIVETEIETNPSST
jgi:hypothetical protein